MKTKQVQVKPRKKFKTAGFKGKLMHFVCEFEDSGEKICTYKFWSRRWQQWQYETKNILDFKHSWELAKEIDKENSINRRG